MVSWVLKDLELVRRVLASVYLNRHDWIVFLETRHVRSVELEMEKLLCVLVEQGHVVSILVWERSPFAFRCCGHRRGHLRRGRRTDRWRSSRTGVKEFQEIIGVEENR